MVATLCFLNGGPAGKIHSKTVKYIHFDIVTSEYNVSSKYYVISEYNGNVNENLKNAYTVQMLIESREKRLLRGGGRGNGAVPLASPTFIQLFYVWN